MSEGGAAKTESSGRKRRPRLGLLTFFFGCLTLLAIVPTLGLGLFQASRWEAEEVERAQRTMTFAVQSLSRQVGQVMDGYTRAAAFLAGQLGVSGGLEAPGLRDRLEEFRARFGGFHALAVLDPNGHCKTALPVDEADSGAIACGDYAQAPFFQEARRQRRLVLSTIEKDVLMKRPGVHVTTPIIDGSGALAGFLVGAVTTSVFQAYVTQLRAEFDDLKAVLVDRKGTVAAHSDDNEGDDVRSLASVPLYEASTARIEETRHGTDEKGIAVVATAAPIRTLALGWTAVVSQPAARIEARAAVARNDALTTAALALLLGLVLAALMAAWLSRPIARLAAWATRVAKSNVTSAPQPPGRWQPREIADLSDAAGTMVAQLEERTLEVERIVERRTDALREANKELRRQIEERTRIEEDLRLVLRATTDVVWTWDLAADSVTWSDALEKRFGYAQENIEKNIAWRNERVHNDDRFRVVTGLRRATESDAEFWSDEFRFRRHDGTYATVIDHAYIARDAFGVAVRLIGAMVDVTDRRDVELRLLQAQKMEAMGRLAGGVAHDFNNLLVSIMGFSELLLERLPRENPMRADLEEINRAGKQAAGLTRQLLAFSRKQVFQPKVLDLNAVVSGMEKMLRRLIGENIELRAAFENGLPRIRADRGQIEQVVLNLVVNARDAMPNGGRVELETAAATHPFPQEGGGLARARCVRLTVRDSGTGMDEATRQRIFEPFFTTKPTGQGTGLGLSTVYGIVQQSGGVIEVVSTPGQGARFDIFLPRADEVTVERNESEEGLPLVGGTETVLLVEDEASVRNFVTSVLRAGGYKVIEADCADDALARLSAHDDGLDLLITDVIMPGMSGPDLAALVRTRRPELRVLFMSGYSETPLDVVTARPGNGFMQKPFAPRALAYRVREVLDGPSPLQAPLSAEPAVVE